MRVIKWPVRRYVGPQEWETDFEAVEVPAPRPREWEQWAVAMATKRLPEDRGLGDTIEHEIGPIGTPAFLEWYHAQFGRQPCPNCPALWNRLYPYEGHIHINRGGSNAD